MTSIKRKRYERDRMLLLQVWVSLGSPKFRTICECAVGPFSLVEPYRHAADKILMIEPDPVMAEAARQAYPWAEIVEAAIAREVGEAKLRRMQGASFISGIKWSPAKEHAMARAKRSPLLPVKTITFDSVDDGEIDFLNLDCEGSEFYVLELFHKHGFYREIMDWFEKNGYRRHPMKLRNVNIAFVRNR